WEAIGRDTFDDASPSTWKADPCKKPTLESHRGQVLSQVGCALGKEFFGDSVRRKASAQPQQVGGGWLVSLQALEGEFPGGSNWLRVVGDTPTTPCQQDAPLAPVELLIGREGAAGFFQIGSGLVQGQGQAAQLLGQLEGQGAVLWAGLL